jgi:hypothetical protein
VASTVGTKRTALVGDLQGDLIFRRICFEKNQFFYGFPFIEKNLN